MRLDSYTFKARIAPAVLTIIIPIMIFNHFYASDEFLRFVGNVFGAKILSNLAISTICLYFLSEIGRLLGKNVFERLYSCDEQKMPTTIFMLFKDKTFSDDYKIRVREKVFNDFGIRLLNKEEEFRNEHLASVKIVETMALIRKKLKDNSFLLQHNIEYGAMRNALGGAIIGSVLSIGNIVFFKFIVPNTLAVIISSTTLFIYILLLLTSKIIISFYGRNYAKVLFREYLG